MTDIATFKGEDNGFCRVYYRRVSEGRAVALYCWQLDGPGRFMFLRCTRDGEPDYEVKGWGGVPAELLTPLPPGETSIGRELRVFLEARKSQLTPN